MHCRNARPLRIEEHVGNLLMQAKHANDDVEILINCFASLCCLSTGVEDAVDRLQNALCGFGRIESQSAIL